MLYRTTYLQSRKKGLSVEEKRQKMIEIFYEKEDFFSLKELEKIAPKEKGIVSQSVKDVVQSLVDDGMIDTDKIGTSVYFWAFPSKASNNRKRKIEELQSKVEEVKKKCQSTKEMVNKAKIGKEESDERLQFLSQLQAAKKEKELLLTELQRYKDNDPQALEEMKKEIGMAKDAVNRWTDNIFSLKSWCKNKFFFEESILNKQFGIDENLDYIE